MQPCQEARPPDGRPASRARSDVFLDVHEMLHEHEQSEEERVLNQGLYDLRMRYVEVAKGT